MDRGSSRSPAPSAPPAKKKAAMDRGSSRSPEAKKKAARPTPSTPLVVPPPKFHISMEAPVREQARLKRSWTEAGQERCPSSGGETLPPDIQHPDVTSTPTLPQFLSSATSKH